MVAANGSLLNRNYQVVGKMIALAILTVFFLIPLFWISNTISDRVGYYTQAKEEVAKSWSQPQIVSGPFLTVPYLETDRNGVAITKNYIFLPDDLKMDVSVIPQTRSRGIFDVIVYEAVIRMQGGFTWPQKLNVSDRDLRWGEAKVVLGVTDARGIDPLKAIVGKKETLFEPGIAAEGIDTVSGSVFPPSTSKDAQGLPFDIGLTLKGSESIEFMPLGKETLVNIRSKWSSPGFIGNFLPIKRNIGQSGFSASWKIPLFARSIPHHFSGTAILVNAREKNSFGVRLIDPVSGYAKSERAIKYAVLFILYTFLFYFLFEIVKNERIHIFQYTITACSLLCFFVLLTAFSERISFEFAYLAASLAIIFQISFYIFKVIQFRLERLSFLAVLVGVYAYLYVILQMEDYAFLVGALGMFVAISCAMYFTRNVNWFEKSVQPNN